MVKNGRRSSSTRACFSSVLGGADHQQVVVLLARRGVDGGVVRRAVQHEAAAAHEVRRPVAPRGAEARPRAARGRSRRRPRHAPDGSPRLRPGLHGGDPSAGLSVSRHRASPPGPRARRGPSRRPPICFLPNALTSPSRTALVPVPTSTSFLRTSRTPGASGASGCTAGPLTRADLDPLAVVRRPGAGAGRAGADPAVDGGRRPRSSRPGRPRPGSSGRG